MAPGACCADAGLDFCGQPFFKVLLDETRRELINFVGWHPALTAGEIAAAFKQDRSTISHHLSVMTTHGFLKVMKEGRNRRYRVDRDYVVKTLERLTESVRNCCRNC